MGYKRKAVLSTNAKVIPWDKVDEALENGANGVQIAAAIGVAPDTLYRAAEREHGMTFAVYSQTKRASGDAKLLGWQMAAAKDGSVPMMIWLGKNRLGQSDKLETKNSHDVNVIQLVTLTPEEYRKQQMQEDDGK